ncbi:AAA-type ATPase/40S ribosome biogenesis Tsr1 and BMS1 C-terminal/AARP2CN (NUC121) domain-containing protein [Cryptosporidium hominis]|uniref:AAA-type ATPase/40S ribosome biogenesis Tsr1 and BMS1 C-terminal/AARP2CN (NUC121) domain-containing protein n=1 Tax=Cryptosporidium hominis TaxID=237895 RepID=A0ABX5BFN7_CRYHO|nr:AAA-type ATPase/40S ribosome biogenesis Tsr1 and BMS1 C-terminal/AARP2CN (NUC121) domain-containing protein [Cryptosporidium hominis]|eukprot:PPS96358.1 AAA-type ATPase/40S ribosome biogenesis Tsr1 and BMS1 C-terminal/AARP2CN (NUC121) domain-containing protein [Cryptosporidium hominis]
MEEIDRKKSHRTHLSKRKVLKKKLKKEGADKKERHNPKAFTFSGGVKSVQRRVQRTLDITSKREKAPGIDKSNVEDESTPPYIVAVQGPPGVGKTTLIRSLVKNYTKYNLNVIDGTVTLVSSKNRRLTFIECPNDMHGMIDVAKVADLVLLLIDASFSFEMETFEFLNILQVHGFPRVLGVLTHLDKIEDNKTLRKTKKKLKNRFWTEIYNGAKLFYLSGIHNGFYNKTEIRNLSRFIAVQKFENLSWRSSHPYIVSLRIEEINDDDNDDYHQNNKQSFESKNPETSVYFYGFVKGGIMRKNQSVHIPGLGDYLINDIDEFNDPCPLPETSIKKNGTNAGLRVLKTKERNIYAPYCDVGNVQIDSNSMYIHIPDNTVNFTRRKVLFNDDNSDSDSDVENNSHSEEEENLDDDIQDIDESFEGEEEEEEEEDDDDNYYHNDINPKSNSSHSSSESNSEDEEYLPEAVKYVRKLQKSQSVLNKRVNNLSLKLLPSSEVSLENSILYEESSEAGKNKGFSNDDDLMETEYEETNNQSYYSEIKSKNSDNFLFSKNVNYSLKDLVYGRNAKARQVFKKMVSQNNNKSINSKKALFDDDLEDSQDDLSSDTDDIGEILDSFRINDVYIYPTKPKSIRELVSYWTEEKFYTLKQEKFITGGIDNSDDEEDHHIDGGLTNKENEASGNTEDINDSINDQNNDSDSNQDNSMMDLESKVFKIGRYVRIRIDNIDKEWIRNHQGITILGTLLPGESVFGNINIRIKKHRWYPKILKSDDVLTFSIGWRRFQSIPLYSIEDRNETRYRMLKYTPEHMHCYCTTYGPIIPCNFGILAIRSSERTSNFRIAATGVSVEMQAKSNIVKKLKLVGEPKKIHKNTAFIHKMFNSDLEVSKFIGAKIQTVSGIRGQVKKAISTHGLFRATFEDKILLSDIVFCKTWVSMTPREFYNPVIDLPTWRRMRTQAELRRELNIPLAIKADSEYVTKQDRPEKKRFNSVPVPSKLEKELPYASKTKNDSKKIKDKNQVAVIKSTFEKRVANLFQRLSTIQKEKTAKRIEKKRIKREINIKRRQPLERIREAKNEERKKRRYALQGIKMDKQRRKLMMKD